MTRGECEVNLTVSPCIGVIEDAEAQRAEIIDAVKAAGYMHVTIDPEGLRHGSMNEGLKTIG